MAVIGGTVLIRRFDVIARLTDEVADVVACSEGGVLLDQLIGRYVLNADARKVWRLIDGQRSVWAIAKELERSEGETGLEEPVRKVCERLHEIGVVEEARTHGRVTSSG